MELKYINPPFCYTGSKFKLLPQLLPLFDYSKSNFIDMFAGGGAVFANILDEYDTIYVNDILHDLIEIHKGLAWDGVKFIDNVKSYCVSKDDQVAYVNLRAVYNKEHKPEQLMALGLCSQNNFFRFNKKGEFNQTWGKRSFNAATQKKLDVFLPHVDRYKSKLRFWSMAFRQFYLYCHDSGVVGNGMFYLDPPYNSKFQGAANYNAFWGDEDDEQLYKMCLDINDDGNSFALSNVWSKDVSFNAPVVNLLLTKGFQMVKLEGDYKKVARKKDKEQMTEVVIKNY